MPIITEEEELQTYQSFDNQIGGHLKIKGVTCMVADGIGNLLKYVENSNVGRTEELFYATIFSDPEYTALRKFLPNYYGKIFSMKEDTLLTYLKLENAIHGLVNPNIVDIKIGKVTYDPFATKEKTHKECTKYPAQREIGFRFSGMKVFNMKRNNYDVYSGTVFRSCTCYGTAQEKTLRYLKQFMGFFDRVYHMKKHYCECCHVIRTLAIKHLIKHFIADLNEIIIYMERQTQIKFYASSILLAYDSERLNSISFCTKHKLRLYVISLIPVKHKTDDTTMDHICVEQKKKMDDSNKYKKEKENNFTIREVESTHAHTHFDGISRLIASKQEPACKNVHIPYCVKMIDFGHSYINVVDTTTIDYNYLFGLKNLVEYFKCTLNNI